MDLVTTWVDECGHLHIELQMDNVVDVIFESVDCAPRSVRFGEIVVQNAKNLPRNPGSKAV